ncbi:MAG: formylglycine-generating enzyme family protein [Candidatus Zipacnadales bacterium]
MSLTNIPRREWFRITGAGLATTTLGAWLETKTTAQESEMIVIPAGPCIIGTSEAQAEALAREHGYHVSWLEGELPQRKLDVPAFAIDKYPVTNAQYAEFCAATGYRAPTYWHGDKPPAHLFDHPVVAVNRADAIAYCRWAGKRLPTEIEWEKAARGEEGLVFPWGNEFDPNACQWNPQRLGGGLRTAPVDSHPRGASPYGVMDMVGNVAEWCADPPPPHGALRGGCWLTSEVFNLRAAARNMNGFDNNAALFYGFRCVKGIE